MKEKFVTRAQEVHGDKYDYSKVEYVSSKTPVIIICPKHGEFTQLPIVHLNGHGCPNCGREITVRKVKKMNNELFAVKSNAKHNNEYDYSLSEYVDKDTEIKVICHHTDENGKEHGVFMVKPYSHMSGYHKCPKCFPRTYDKTWFLKRVNEIYGDRYDCSKVEYVNNHTKVAIICPEHGPFKITPNEFLDGHGCPTCSQPNRGLKFETFVNRANDIHHNKFDYSEFVWHGIDKKGIIICHEKDENGNEHGPFEQTPRVHLSGCCCPKCSGNYHMTNEEYIEKARKIHSEDLDYSKTMFTGMHNKITITCKKHGDFTQEAASHLKGCGCPDCQREIRKMYKFNLLEEFKSEFALREFLETNDVNIIYIILRNIEPKYEPIKVDLIKALGNGSDIDPIHSLEEKYKSDDDTDEEAPVEETTDISEPIDLDDIDAVNKIISQENTAEEKRELTIEDVMKNREQELKVINRIEHMLTPEDRKYIMDKFFNDQMREYMASNK